MNGLRQPLHIAARDAGHGDAAILGGIDGMLKVLAGQPRCASAEGLFGTKVRLLRGGGEEAPMGFNLLHAPEFPSGRLSDRYRRTCQSASKNDD